MTGQPPEAVAGLGVGVPLVWTGEAGYQCPYCSLFVCISEADCPTCPRCAPIPLDEAATLLLACTGLDEGEAVEAVQALKPLLNLTTRSDPQLARQRQQDRREGYALGYQDGGRAERGEKR